jgi:hypothetical protein
MYDFLLFVHVLAAFMLMVTVVAFTAYALGWPATPRGLTVSGLLWDIGGMGTLIFGIWLALHEDEYGFFDGWILGAIGLWMVATMAGMRARWAIVGTPGSDKPAEPLSSLATWHWIRVVATIAILVLMIYKPGA